MVEDRRQALGPVVPPEVDLEAEVRSPGLFGGSLRRYSVQLSISANNILNHPSYATPSGDLTSPYFGQYRSLSSFGPAGTASTYDRKIDVQLRFTTLKSNKEGKPEMITRRLLIRGALSSAAATFVFQAKAAKGDFWNEKQPDAWSATEIEKLLSRSPWAKEADVDLDLDGFAGGPPGGRHSGGTKLVAGGGFPGGGPMGGGQFKPVIRWESAKAIMDARKKGATDDFAKYYVLSLSGTPRNGMPATPIGDDDADPRREQMQANMRQSTQLQIKGKAPLKAERIEPSETGILFLFSRDDHPIKRDDKEVTFQAKLGPLQLKARFVLKDMLYRDQLEL